MKSNNESAFHITDIQWDTDDEEVEGLPESYCLPFSKLLYENESLDDVDIQELRDRIADNMSDHYGFCVIGLATT